MYDDYDTRQNGWQGYFAPLLQARTYTNLLYLVLALPLGVLYFTVLVTGYAMGFPMLIVLVGLPILALTMALAEQFLRWERLLANWLLGTDMRVQPRLKRRGGMLARMRSRLTDSMTWRGQVFLFARFAFGIVAPILLSLAWALPLVLIFGPIDDPSIVGPVVLIPMAIGLGLAPLSARASNWLADWWRVFAVSMLAERENTVSVPQRDPYRLVDDDYDDAIWEDDLAYDADEYAEKPKRKAKTLAELLGEE